MSRLHGLGPRPKDGRDMRGRADNPEQAQANATTREKKPGSGAGERDRRRWAAGAAAVLLLTTAVVVGAVIVPPVSGDTYPTVNRDASVVAFAVHIVMAVAAAGLLLGSATVSRTRLWPAAGMVVAIILALALLDAASEFRTHGSDLRVATWAMWLGAGIELGAALLAGWATFAGRERRARR